MKILFVGSKIEETREKIRFLANFCPKLMFLMKLGSLYSPLSNLTKTYQFWLQFAILEHTNLKFSFQSQN